MTSIINIGCRRYISVVLVSVALLAARSACGEAADTSGQAVASSNGLEEIVVTARKREESILKAPVVVSVVTPKEIENLKITDAYALGQVTPGLMISQGFASVGTVVYMRGLGQGTSISFGDQSVLLNVDGVSLPHGAFYKTGLFDLSQIEILKGPQALFFGKSASAGIIAINSADPTDSWESKVATGYEFNAEEVNVDGFVSGPITDKLGIRVAAYYDTLKGWLYDENPAADPHRLPDSHENGGRLTLKYDDSDAGLRAKLKLTDAYTFTRLNSSDNQGVCWYGYRQLPAYRPYDDCQVNDTVNPNPNGPPYNPNVNWFSVYGNPAPFATGSPFPLARDGKPYAQTRATSVVLNMDYDLGNRLTLTSVSSYNKLTTTEAEITALAPTGTFQLDDRFYEGTISQELRVSSSWQSWINFIAGGFYSPERLNVQFDGNFPTYTLWDTTFHQFVQATASGFGQIILTPIDKWELDAGLRYTDVKQRFTEVLYTTVFMPTTNFTGLVPSDLDSLHETNTSPEFTLSYRPIDDLTTFLSYKRGYKGPGSNAALNVFAPYTANSGNIVPFGGERVRGVEGGIKGKGMDNRLTYSLSGYYYDYLGLQVSFFDPITEVSRTVNGADAKVEGLEGNVSFAPDIAPGLVLTSYANLNNSRYTKFDGAPCWPGQPASDGCNAAGQQSLTGKRLHLAPLWTGTFTADYKTAVTGNYEASVGINVDVSSSYNTIAEQNPIGIQKSYATLDTNLHFGPRSGLWDLAFLCRNLTNEYFMTAGVNDGLVPSSISGAPAPRADGSVYVSRGRQFMLQVTMRPRL